MPIKLIALDLDGTLLNEDKQISKANKEALALAREKGVKVVITTGRPLPSIQAFLEELDLVHENEYSLTFNGGLVQKNNGDIIDQIVFGYDDVKEIYETTQSLGLPLDVVQGGQVYMLDAAVDSLYPTCNKILNYIPFHFTDLQQDAFFNKAVSCCDPEYLDERIAQLPPHLYEKFEIFKSRTILLEWSPKGVHKASGLEKLIAHLGMDRSEVMTCGDEDNDLSMIEWAGLGVCMANGSEKVKAVADVVTPMTNEEDAVSWAVRKYVLNEE
ncbi:Cof-type HAD-IIB family hydrolase [Streptococcus cameli]